MSGSRHTPDPRAPLKRSPGPWVVTHRHVDGTAYDDEIDGLGLEIEAIERPLIRGDYALAGDAHLIAAAPELLEALISVRNTLIDATADGDCNLPGLLEYVTAVIARAEGREP